MTLMNLWKQSNEKPGLKVRYIDWDFKLNYFEIQSYNQTTETFEGFLCNGEKVSYKANSMFWTLFESEDQTSILVA